MTKVRSEVRFELQRPVKNTMDLIIVDTSGRHKQEQSLFDEMQAIVVFVMDRLGAVTGRRGLGFRV
jgi:signal recognition particle GTPase